MNTPTYAGFPQVLWVCVSCRTMYIVPWDALHCHGHSVRQRILHRLDQFASVECDWQDYEARRN